MFLTEPSLQFKESFLSGVREFHREGRLLFYDVLRISANFERFLQQEHAQQDRARIAPGRDPTRRPLRLTGIPVEKLASMMLCSSLRSSPGPFLGWSGYRCAGSANSTRQWNTIRRVGSADGSSAGECP